MSDNQLQELSLPAAPQPEAVPLTGQVVAPSIRLYVALLANSAVLVATAFGLQTEPDWPGLLLNLGAGLIGAVVVLVFVDRRLRTTDIEAMRNLPREAAFVFSAWLTPTGRLSRRYCRSLLIALEPLLRGKLNRPSTKFLESRISNGLVLQAPPGSGKTTWLQMVAQSLASKALQNRPGGRAPVLFTLSTWPPDASLEDAIYSHVAAFCTCKRRWFLALLESGKATLLFDGYDEIRDRVGHFTAEVTALRKKFPKVELAISSRPDGPVPDAAVFGETQDLPLPTEGELAEIARRRARRASRY